MILVFSTLVHYSGLKLLNHLTLSIQNVVSVVGPNEAIYAAHFLQLFTSLSIAAVFGIWMAPYAHRGERSLLTHVLPLSKVKFSFCYVLCCVVLLLINELVLLGSFGVVFGFSSLAKGSFSLILAVKTFAFQTLCLEVLMLALALSSLILGQVTTVFLGGSSLFIMQVLGTFARFFKQGPEFSLLSPKGLLVFIYHKLPPVGDFIFDFMGVMKNGIVPVEHLILWMFWFIAFNLLFWFKVRYPIQARSTEA